MLVHPAIPFLASEAGLEMPGLIGMLVRYSALIRMNPTCKWAIDLLGFRKWQDKCPYISIREAASRMEEFPARSGFLHDVVVAMTKRITSAYPEPTGTASQRRLQGYSPSSGLLECHRDPGQAPVYVLWTEKIGKLWQGGNSESESMSSGMVSDDNDEWTQKR
ncbi:hypothetical protein CC79DRAFT_1326509 [Sarocladium strictum]